MKNWLNAQKKQLQQSIVKNIKLGAFQSITINY